MEGGPGTPPAEALGTATEPLQRPPSPAEPGKPDGAAPSQEGQCQRQRFLRAAYICNQSPEDSGPEKGALQCLVRACEAQGARLSTMRFGELDFKETTMLEAFYNAGEAGIPFTPSHVPFLSASLALGSSQRRRLLPILAPLTLLTRTGPFGEETVGRGSIVPFYK